MKLDVSYTDHSHIIGKGGQRIKQVMEETKCHIHFPDSNRNNEAEKSNQVSIAGEMINIEKARARVRVSKVIEIKQVFEIGIEFLFRLKELTPLIFCFELPNVGTLQKYPDQTSSFVVSVQDTYHVQVMFRTRAKLHSTLVMVKGCELEVFMVKEATMQLITHMCGDIAVSFQIGNRLIGLICQAIGLITLCFSEPSENSNDDGDIAAISQFGARCSSPKLENNNATYRSTSHVS